MHMSSTGPQIAHDTQRSNSAHRPLRYSASMSPHPSTFAPLLFAGQLEQGIELLPHHGFSALELSLRRASELVDLQWLEEQLAKNGLVISAFATGRMCLEDSLCLSDTNTDARERIFERLSDLISLAAHFNAGVIIGGVRGKLSDDNIKKFSQWDAAVDMVHRCAEIADSLNVRLLVEPINRYETNFINTGQEGLDFIRTVGHSSVKLLLDTYHMSIEEADPASTIRMAGGQLGYVHFADDNRLAPGQGHIDFSKIFDALTGIGYQGFINAEILPIPDDRQALMNAGQFLHSLIHERI